MAMQLHHHGAVEAHPHLAFVDVGAGRAIEPPRLAARSTRMPISSRMVSAVSWMARPGRPTGSRSAGRAASAASTAAAGCRRSRAAGDRACGVPNCVPWLPPIRLRCASRNPVRRRRSACRAVRPRSRRTEFARQLVAAVDRMDDRARRQRVADAVDAADAGGGELFGARRQARRAARCAAAAARRSAPSGTARGFPRR